MNVLDCIAGLRRDLDRTIESLEALRNGFASYASIAPELDHPFKVIEPSPGDPRLKDFFTECCRSQEGAFVRTGDLWIAYNRWCKLKSVESVGLCRFSSRIKALGYEYSRSRRINGRQARTWEGVGLVRRKKLGDRNTLPL